MISAIIQLLLFGVAVFTMIGLGLGLIGRARRELTLLEAGCVTLVSGMAVWMGYSYGIAWLGGRPWLSPVPVILAIAGWWSAGIPRPTLKWMKLDRVFLALLVLGVGSQLFLVAPSGLKYADGLRLYGVNAHDGMWHVALMQTLKNPFPPQMPTVSQAPLAGYHYLVDLFGSELSRLLGISPLWLVFRLLPGLFALVAGMGVYAVGRRLTHSIPAARMGVFLTYFGGSLAYLLPLVLPGKAWSETSFWAQQSISTLINLPLAASFAVATVILIFLERWTATGNRSFFWWAAFLTGISVGIKAYTGGLLLAGFGLICLVAIAKKRFEVVLPGIMALGLFFGLTWGQARAGTGFLLWEPGWFVKTMMEAPDRVGVPRWELVRQVYVAHQNVPRLLLWWGAAGLIFLVGNAGVRMWGGRELFRWKQNYAQPARLMMVTGIWGGIIIPLLFIQSGIVWNTIQFLYVSLFFLNLMVVLAFSRLKQGTMGKIVTAVIVLGALPTTLKTWGDYLALYRNPTGYHLINTQELKALAALRQQEKGVVLAPYQDTAYVTGLTGQAVYFADDTQAALTGIDFEERKRMLARIFCGEMNEDKLKVFLNQEKIAYLYLPLRQSSSCNNPTVPVTNYLIPMTVNHSTVLYTYTERQK